MSIPERRSGSTLPVDTLIILSALRREQHLDDERLAPLVQRDAAATRATLDSLVAAGLVAAGLVAAHGRTRGRNYLPVDDVR